jgi:hypothetical protein
MSSSSSWLADAMTCSVVLVVWEWLLSRCSACDDSCRMQVLCLAQTLAKVNQADYVPATAEAATRLGQLHAIDWATLNHKGQRQQP